MFRPMRRAARAIPEEAAKQLLQAVCYTGRKSEKETLT